MTVLIFLTVYTFLSLIEYFGYLSGDKRKVIFFGFVIFGVLLVIQFIGVPMLKLFHILKPIDIKSSSTLIQKHFSDIKDKLINIIELADIYEEQYSNEIVLASIDQKIKELKIFDFKEAIQFKNLRLVLLYLIISLVTVLSIFIINKSVFAESTHRIIHYNTQFIKPAPFSFQLVNSSLQAKKGDAFKIMVNCKGDEIPKIVYINIEGNNYLMKNTVEGNFEFEIVSVINTINFYFTDLKFNSEKFVLDLLPKPAISGFELKIFPPFYTGLQNQSLENIGDIQIPNGTKIEWNFNGIDIDSLFFLLSDSTIINSVKNQKVFTIESKFVATTDYNVFIQNKMTEPELALSYSIEVIPDLFPEIEIVQMKDSFQLTRFFFKGIIGDDYGFSDLNFHYNINNSDSLVSIPFIKSLADQEFYFSFDFSQLNQASGVISYYFSVTDNDVINNYKTTTSDNFIFEIPSNEQISATEKERFQNIEKLIEQSREMAKDINSDLKNLRLKNMDTNVSEWEKSQMVNDVISKQNKLEQLYDKIKQDNENLNNYLNSFKGQNQDMFEKQQEIESLLEEVFTDELKKLMEEFNKLAEEFDSKKLNQLSEQMDLTFEDLQKQLDKNLELLRKMKVEQKLQDVIDGINKMADEEEQLAQDVVEKKNFQETTDKVSEHQEELKQLNKNLDDALELNDELNKPMNFDDFDNEFKEIENSLEESKTELDKNNTKKSGKGINNTSEQLKNMAFSMQQMLQSNTMQQNMENIENLKQLLSNLIILSFSQEEILTELGGINTNDPGLVQLNKRQKSIVNQSKVVKDSLYALAMRTPQITSMVNNELLSMELSLSKSVEQMEEALFPNARASQQFVITAANNLALMLNEALENLEKQMADGMSGDQQCEKPGGGKPGMDMLKKASDNIKQQLQQMIDQMKSGQGQQMNNQLGQSLIQHEMMQQMLRELMNSGGVGSSAKKQLQQIDEMLEQNRKEIMNKTINAQTIVRQNLINTRLLEAEKAEIERDFENKRDSKSAEEFYSNPVKFFEYKERDNYSIEYLNKNTHKLNNFYNIKYKQYLNNMEK
ncbi:MAG: hypothetical protein HN778_01650 [Prolixibacteraceae bacterium]|nr:hypothetical protein [Prolixibacteraceae bacterium]MBT6005981.1 hypothetical protein [Prolixibacteraceae bacterium]MBT6766236.1 hypothetical protein [Prolixibacteraceae bacterium]MBT7000566.1 hypothetical protein [Prolixibacteraceae bacterium]MBT7393514.1 hypothetical protein [Prolixibacteraceae bacterium]